MHNNFIKIYWQFGGMVSSLGLKIIGAVVVTLSTRVILDSVKTAKLRGHPVRDVCTKILTKCPYEVSSLLVVARMPMTKARASCLAISWNLNSFSSRLVRCSWLG
jgi:hypothetical protein